MESERAKAIEVFVAENSLLDHERTKLRKIGELYDQSYSWAKDPRNRCLNRKVSVSMGSGTPSMLRNLIHQLLQRGRPGSKPGHRSERMLTEAGKLTKIKNTYKNLGAAKINAIAGTSIGPHGS